MRAKRKAREKSQSTDLTWKEKEESVKRGKRKKCVELAVKELGRGLQPT